MSSTVFAAGAAIRLRIEPNSIAEIHVNSAPIKKICAEYFLAWSLGVPAILLVMLYFVF
jgi:hypothetical protein